MIKKLLIAVLLLIPLVSYSQNMTISSSFVEAGSYRYGSLTAIDSLTTYQSGSFDLSSMDGQTMYVWYDYVTPGGTADTLKISIISYFPGINPTSGSSFTLDTMYVVGQTSSTPVVRATSTFFSFWPTVYVKVENTSSGNRDGTALRWAIYSKTEDYVRTAQQFGNVRP